MAGYADTRELIINTLMGRPAGTEIQPEDHQAFALQIIDYIRSVELVAGSGVPVEFAEPDTVPVQPDNGQAVYLSYVPRNVTKNFVNFINQSGNSISVTSSSGEVKLVTLLWNGSYWSSQIVTIDVLSDDSSVNASNIGASDYILFSTSSNYSIGDIVRYDGKLYKFTTEHAAGTWNGTDVELASINSILTSKLSELESKVGSYGLNIFDEVFELGDIGPKGQLVPGSTTLRTKNFTPCLSDWDYSISMDKAYIYFYKEDGTFISLANLQNTPIFHTPNNAELFKLVLFTDYGTTYNNDVKICQKFNWIPDIAKAEERINSRIDGQDEKISVVVKEYNSPQLFDRNKNLSGQMDVNGIVSPNASYVYTPDAINVAENVGRTIYFSSDTVPKKVQKVITYDANGNITNDYATNVFQFTIPVGVATIRLSYYSNEEDSSYAHLQAEYDEITPYVEYGSELIPLVPCNIIVSKSGKGDYTTLTEAVANAKNGDVIFVRKGVYDNEEVEAFGKDITIIGEDVNSTIIKNGLDLYARPPIEMSIGKLANLTFHSYGVDGGDNRHAYALHNDDNSLQDKTFIAENCIFHTRSGYGAVGMGLRKGCVMTFKDCVFLNESPSGVPFFGNESALSQGPAGEQRLNFYDCQFITTQAQRAAIFRGMKTLGNYVICTFIGNTFVSTDTSLTIRLDYTSPEYIGTSERMGNMGLVNWDLTYSSRLNNIEELNIARTGNTNIIQ